MKSLTKSSVSNIKIDAAGNEKESNADLVRVVGVFSGMAIYFFIFLFASQVLRGVLEEKTNRIVEVLISSVKPIQLMMGKIVGIAMVGLTQFLIWVVLTFAIIYGVQLSAPTLFEVTPEVAEQAATLPDGVQVPMADVDSAPTAQTSIFTKIDNYFNISFTALLLCFLFYFLIGYLIYAALFAAVGSAVDNEADSQQFTMPVTIPLILAMVLIVPITEDPNGSIAFWFSMIPLTSPIAMMIRLPSGVPADQLFASMAIAVAFFILCVWFAAKIYRVGVLMYGKKVTYRELFKWLKY
jgi:ABC-2 type transport system permease protein